VHRAARAANQLRLAGPDLAITWPEGLELVVSARDAQAPRLREVADDLPFLYTTSPPGEFRS